MSTITTTTTTSTSTTSMAAAAYQIHDEYDYLVKCVVIGDSGVGKSSIVKCFADQTFTPTFITTIGVDFEVRSVRVGSKTAKLQIWDTAGQERFRSITNSYYANARVVAVVYDLSDMQSFVSVRRWLQDVKHYAHEDVKVVLVGNKADISESRVVTAQMGRDLAAEVDAQYLECSARTKHNVNQVFDVMAREYVELAKQRAIVPDTQKRFTVLDGRGIQSDRHRLQCPTCTIV